MERQGASEAIFIALNFNITIVGKLWLILMVFFRILVLFLAGYPLYQDEQERFVCNTIQPGCANVCYDIFAPLSLFRFWLVQFTCICLPFLVFIVYVIHKVTLSLSVHPQKTKVGSVKKLQQVPFYEASQSRVIRKMPLFTDAYIFHLLLQILLEAGFGAAHYFLFGFNIPKCFICQHAPCTTMVDCYVSRPTEKTIMLNFMLGMAALSLLLKLFDLICAIKRSVRQKSQRKLVEKMYEEEQCFFAERQVQGGVFGNPENHSLLANGSFGKRNSKATDDGAPSHLVGSSHATGSLRGTHLGINPGVPCLLNCNEAGGYLGSHDEETEHEGSEVALCLYESTGTPRSIWVNKRSRLKPLPPPRQGIPSTAGSLDIPSSRASSPKRRGQYKLAEMSTESGVLSSGGDGCDKRSKWV